MIIRVFEAFAGYGSQSLALERLKRDYPDFEYEVVGISEIDKYAIQAYNALHPGITNYGDISKMEWYKVPDFDLLTYSFPCTDISNVGQQKGFEEGSGTRSSLLWECRKAEELYGRAEIRALIRDYSEQKFDGGFEIMNTKKLDFHRIIIDELKKKDTSAVDYLTNKITGEEYAWSQYKGAKDESDISLADFKWYQIVAKFDYVDRPGLAVEQNYLVYTYDAAKAEHCIITKQAAQDAADAKRGEIVQRKSISLEKVSQLAVNFYIPMEFTDAYVKADRER